MLKTWLRWTTEVLEIPDNFHISGKRISRGHTFETTAADLMTPDITLSMLGFSKKKITMLTDYYLNEESVRVALYQLEHRREKNTYGSVGITTYNHFAKKERPMHGPCIQSVVLTHSKGGKIDMDVFYRTTEIFKKFAADLIWLREIFLPQFNITNGGVVRFHFANITYHPMYWVVSAPYLSSPVESLIRIHSQDPITWKGIIRWTERYVKQPDNLLKFKQAHRVSKHMHLLVPKPKMKELAKYISKNYKLVSNTVIGEDEDEV
jgi:hypothetical protein